MALVFVGMSPASFIMALSNSQMVKVKVKLGIVSA